jgi:hypothetical protein
MCRVFAAFRQLFGSPTSDPVRIQSNLAAQAVNESYTGPVTCQRHKARAIEDKRLPSPAEVFNDP